MTKTSFSRRLLPLVATAAVLLVAPDGLAAQLKHGDVNGDGVVSVLDAQAILTSVVSLPLPVGYVVANGDANCDAATGALDAQIVLSYVIGLDVSQHCVAQSFGPGAITMTITPGDTSILINRARMFRAILRDSAGATPQRPVSWATSNADLVAVDSARGDTVWVSNKGAAFDAVATLTATADGVSRSVTVRVVKTYAGLTITPQRPDTLKQLNADYNFFAQNLDSLGNDVGNLTAFWSVADTTIATISGTAATHTGVLRTKVNGATWLIATSSTNAADRDSVRIVVQNPVLSSCSETGGTVYPNTTFTTAQTWTVANGPHFINGTLTFNSGSTLTVEAGALVCAHSGASMVFRQGSRLTAVGTQAQPITFTTRDPGGYWYGIQLGDASGYVTTPIADTSRFTNVLFERGSNGNGVVDGRPQHVVLLDSVRVRHFFYSGVSLMSPGSRMIRSSVDTSSYDYAYYYAVQLGRGSLEESTIRIGNTASAIYLSEAATVRQVTITGGTTAIDQGGSGDSARINDVTITGTTGTALVLDGGLIHPSSGNVTVTGGKGGVFRGGLGNFAHLYPDTTTQSSLKNNGSDTVQIYYGALVNRTLPLRPDLKWRLEGTVQIDTLAQLVLRPGTALDFSNGYLYFIRGGTLDARGTAAAPVHFRPMSGASFYGLDFENPGQGSSPFSTAPVAQSVLTNVRVDSATGVCCSAGFGYGAVIGADRHRLVIDSALVRMSRYGGVHLAARNSRISRSVIDTTGFPTASYPALGLGDSTTADSVTVRRSGHVGVSAPGVGARLRNVRILNSVLYGLDAENGLLQGDSGSVVMEGNLYPGRLRIENLALLAPDSASQRAWFTSTTTDSVVVVSGGNVTRDTVTAIPQLRWQLESQVYFDTLSHFRPRPGARISGWNGGLYFRQGGTLDARGTATRPIRFYPATSGVNFYGMHFENPGAGSSPFSSAPVAHSYLVNVRVDSASGQCCSGSFGYSAVNTGDRHRMTIDSAIVRRSLNGAVHLATRGSSISRSLIDTTGSPTTSYVALGLADSTTADSVTVRRSGHVGVNAAGTGARLRKVEIINSVLYGLSAINGQLLGDSGSVTMQGNQYAGRILLQNLGLLAPDSASQRAWYSSATTDSAIVITGGNLVGDTVTAIPQLRWQVEGTVTFDTLSHFRPRPGARIGGYNGGLYFRQGATIDARGTSAMPIRFYPVTAGVNFYGIELDNAGAGSSPFASAPRDTSYLMRVQIDSASGQCCVSGFGYAAVSANDRHVVLMDSVRVRLAHNGAIHLAARGSLIRRTIVDTTGTPTSGYPAVALGDSVVVDSVIVRRSGQVGIRATGNWVRLRHSSVLNSVSYGLFGETGIFDGDSNVVLSGNLYPARLRIENVARLLPNPNGQGGWVGNLTDVLVVTGGTLTSDTVVAIPQLRWQLEGNPTIGTGALFYATPGAHITGNNSSLDFVNGGAMSAVGTAQDTIRFYPAASNVNFYGLSFGNPTTSTRTSVMQYVRIDSASGASNPTTGYGAAAITTGTLHTLNISNSRIRKSQSGALYLPAANSVINNLVVDTTGTAPTTGSYWNASVAAVRLGASTFATNLFVRRSGHDGLSLEGANIYLSNVQVSSSRLDGVALTASTTYAGQPSTALRSESNQGNGFSIRTNNVTLNFCEAVNNTGHGVATNAARSGVTVQYCDLITNTGFGINNFDNSVTNNANVINGIWNWWGAQGDPRFNQTSTDGVSNNVSNTNFWCGPIDADYASLCVAIGFNRTAPSRDPLERRLPRSVVPWTTLGEER